MHRKQSRRKAENLNVTKRIGWNEKDDYQLKRAEDILRQSAVAAAKPKKAGWKSREALRNPSGKIGCRQCGDSWAVQKGPYGMILCDRCYAVHTHSIAMGLKSTPEIPF